MSDFGLVELTANGDANKGKIGDFKDPLHVTIAGDPVRTSVRRVVELDRDDGRQGLVAMTKSICFDLMQSKFDFRRR